MKRILLPLLTATAAIAMLTGCQTDTGPYPPKNNAAVARENDLRIVMLDRAVQNSVDCNGIQEKPLSDGRLTVTANVRNREARRIQVQINCVFKDENGFPTGDETPFQNLILSENAQEGVTFTSMNNQAKKYTIRVRQAH